MGGIIRQFVDTPTGPGGALVGDANTEFDEIVGANAPATRTTADAVARPPRVAPARGRRRGPALLTTGALVMAAVALSAGSIIAADAVARGPLTDPQAVLSAQKARVAPVVATPPTVPFGSSAGLGNQLSVSVSDPIAYSPGPGATGAATGVDIVSTVTVTNIGGGTVDPRLRFDAKSATRIFDVKQGIRLNTVTTLDPGGSISYRIAWAADAVPTFALQVTSTDSGDTVLYGP